MLNPNLYLALDPDPTKKNRLKLTLSNKNPPSADGIRHARDTTYARLIRIATNGLLGRDSDPGRKGGEGRNGRALCL